MAANPVNVVLDTNILISAIGFGGKPREILNLVLEREIMGVISPVLLAELEDVISKKFPKLENDFRRTRRRIKRRFKMVYPSETINVLRDKPDNRILEAAVERNCDYIITGDKELLKLGNFKKIKIVNTDQFLDLFQV